MPLPELKYARTDTLEIAYEHSGPSEAEPIFLLHGFPYDPRAYDAMVPRLVQAGYRTIVPYLRGYGATRFRKDETPRSGQHAALAHDLLELTDELKIERSSHDRCLRRQSRLRSRGVPPAARSMPTLTWPA